MGIRVRASGLVDLFDCPARWEAKNILGLKLPSAGLAQLGTAVHAGAAVYDLSVIHGDGLTVDDAESATVDSLWNPVDEVDWGEDTQRDLEPVAVSLCRRYCTEISPQFEYVDVEATCEDLELTDLGISLAGTTDRVYRTPDGLYGIADIKTGRNVVGTDGLVKTAAYTTQLGIYELLVESTDKIRIEAPARIVGMTTAKTKGFQRVGIGEVEGARDKLLGTPGTPGLLEFAARIINDGMFYGNPKSYLCNAKYCPRYSRCTWR